MEKNKLQTLMDKINDYSEVNFFDNERYLGCELYWSMKGRGFGNVTIAQDKDTKKWHADSEHESLESLTKILQMAAPFIAAKILEMEQD